MGLAVVVVEFWDSTVHVHTPLAMTLGWILLSSQF